MAWYVAIALDDPFFSLSLSPSDDRAETHPGFKAPGLQTEDAGAPARADLPATPVDGGVFDAPGRYGRRRACCRMVWPSRFSTFSVVHMISAPSSSLCHSFSWFSSHRNCLFTASADGCGDALPFQPVSILSADQLQPLPGDRFFLTLRTVEDRAEGWRTTVGARGAALSLFSGCSGGRQDRLGRCSRS